VLARSSPAHLQPLIDANPKAIVVLLHCSYPYTRDGAYLCSVYENVYLDFGEVNLDVNICHVRMLRSASQVFAMLSGDGCCAVIRQILEMAPGNKIMWSSASASFITAFICTLV
jgi:predicted TIM-barrel fold metal-dependent hydrolase